MKQNLASHTPSIATQSAHPLRLQLEKICENLRIDDINAFTFAGIQFVLTPASEILGKDILTTQAASTLQLIEKLTGQLYERCYVRHFYGDQAVSDKEMRDAPEDEDLTPLFHAANDNKDGWDPGWQIYQTASDGRLFVQKGDRSRAVMAGEYSTYKWPGVAPVAGDFVSVRLFAGSTDVQPSFFFAFGRTLSDQFDEYAIVRFYFHVSAQQAPNLMAQITATLNRYQIPFKLKALVQAKSYTRTDAAVLYIARRYFQIVAALIIDLHDTEQIFLQEGNPLFSRTLIPGVGLAEDPKAGTSFGMHRCSLVAQGLVHAWQADQHDPSAKIRAIDEVFAAHQLNLERAYLNPHSIDIFDAPLFDKETRW